VEREEGVYVLDRNEEEEHRMSLLFVPLPGD